MIDFLSSIKYDDYGIMFWRYNELAKMGRPKAKHPKENKVAIRLSDDEYSKLKEYADKHNKTMTQVVRKGVENIIS